MKPSEAILIGSEAEALFTIHSFTNKQIALLDILRERLRGNFDVFSLRNRAPRTIDALNDSWAIVVHGVGVRFTNARTEEVVDAHVGMFDFPDAFDAWRLELYAESIQSELEDIGPILERLASKGVICPHGSLANHYELPLFA
jgi:hypothetical protein